MLKVKQTFPGNVETAQPASRPQSACFINNQAQRSPWHAAIQVHTMYGRAPDVQLTQTEIHVGLHYTRTAEFLSSDFNVGPELKIQFGDPFFDLSAETKIPTAAMILEKSVISRKKRCSDGFK